jgi:anti-sigma B factor antagonist
MALNVRVVENRSFSRTLRLEGRLDNETAPVLDAELDRVINSTANVVVFDLADLEYISSAGLRSIFRAQQAMAKRSGRTVMVNAQPQVQKVFEIVKAADLGAVFVSVAELDAYLATMQRQVLEDQ